MKRSVRVLVVLLTTVFGGGCGTLVNQSEKGSYLNNAGLYRPHRLYGGVRFDAEYLASPLTRTLRGEEGIESYTKFGSGEIVKADKLSFAEKALCVTQQMLGITLDIPFSFVADTIFLPFDAWAQFKRLTGVRIGERQPATLDPSTSETAVTPPVEKR